MKYDNTVTAFAGTCGSTELSQQKAQYQFEQLTKDCLRASVWSWPGRDSLLCYQNLNAAGNDDTVSDGGGQLQASPGM